MKNELQAERLYRMYRNLPTIYVQLYNAFMHEQKDCSIKDDNLNTNIASVELDCSKMDCN